MTEEIEITKGEKKLTVKYNKYTKKIEITGYFNEEIPDGIFTGQVTERSDGSIYIWSPDMVKSSPLRDVELIISGDDGNLYIGSGDSGSYFIGSFKDGIPFKHRLANGKWWVRVQTEFYDDSFSWAFNDETPFLPNTTKHTFKHSIPIQYQSKVASSYLDRYSNLTIEVNPSHASIVFIRTKDDKKFPFLSTQPIELDDNEGKGAEYTLLITAMGYRTYSKKKIYKNKTITKTDERLTPANDGQNKLTIQLEEK